jgi:hypothetical protein
MRHQCWSLVIVSTERGRQVGDEVLHHGLPRSRGSPVYRRGHGESVFACASTLVRRGEYRAQTGIWRLLGFVSARTIKGRSSSTPSTNRNALRGSQARSQCARVASSYLPTCNPCLSKAQAQASMQWLSIIANKRIIEKLANMLHKF